jgi:hypothetical protein
LQLLKADIAAGGGSLAQEDTTQKMDELAQNLTIKLADPSSRLLSATTFDELAEGGEDRIPIPAEILEAMKMDLHYLRVRFLRQDAPPCCRFLT